MKMRSVLLLLLLCLAATTVPCIAQAQDSTVVTDTASVHTQGREQSDDEEFNVFLFGLFFGAMAMIMTVALVGGVLILLLILSFIILVAGGIISVSALTGWYKKSVGAGLRMATYLTGAICGAATGAAFGWLAQFIWEWSSSNNIVWLTGIIGGFSGGLIAAAIGIWLVRKISASLVGKVK